MNTIRHSNSVLSSTVPLTFVIISLFLLSLSSYPHYYQSLALENYPVTGNTSHLEATKTPTVAKNLSRSFGMDFKDNISQYHVKKPFHTDFYPDKTYTLIGKNIDLNIAPDKRVLTWTFNGTMPGPTIKMTEKENITVKFINQSPNPHTIHFHGYHDELNDGVSPMVLPGQTYLYNITGQPPGVLLYYCDVMPTSQHIKMGMYGALLIEPQNKTNFTPTKEFLLILSEFNVQKQSSFLADYYLINGYADQYLRHPIEALQNELVRIYIVNAGVNLPISLHFHGTMVKNYPSGFLTNNSTVAQSILVGPGDASIIEAKWRYPGNYLFHSHGYQQEHGGRGMIKISPKPATFSVNTDSNASQIEKQYELQSILQRPIVPIKSNNYSVSGPVYPNSFDLDSLLKRNLSNNTAYISIVLNSALPNNEIFYLPSTIKITKGQEVKWTNSDNFIHTVTSGDSYSGGNGEFDSGTIAPNGTFATTFMNEGEYNYYCVYHPWMFGSIIVK